MQIAVQILLEASIKLDCSIAVRSRALVLFHQFLRTTSNRSELKHDETMIAAAAIKCAARYEEENIDYDTIAVVFYSIVNKTTEVLHPKSAEHIAIRKTLITIDYIMQRRLEYIFCHRLAHEFLVPFLSFIFERNFKLAAVHKQISLACIRFANDAYTDPLCLNYKPDHIAIACIHASLHVHGVLMELDFMEPWFQGFSRDLTVKKLWEIKVFLFRLYSGEKKICEEDQGGGINVEDEKENAEIEEVHVENSIQKQKIGKRKHKESYKSSRVHKRKRGEQGKRKHREQRKDKEAENELRDERELGKNKQNQRGQGERGCEERSQRELEQNKKKFEGRVKKEPNDFSQPSCSQGSSNIDKLLSSWTARFRAARNFNCPLTDVIK